MIISTDTNVQNDPVIFFENLIQSGLVDASTSADGYPVTGLQNGHTTDPWMPTAMPSTVTLTLAGSATATALCLAGHDLHAKGVTVILERLVSGSWAHVISGNPEDAGPFILSFPARDATQWRIRFTGSNTFRLAVATLGSGLIFPGLIQPPHTPLHQASEAELIGAGEGSTGEFLQADYKKSGGRANINFGMLRPDFVSGSKFQSFRDHYNRGRPFFIACFPRFSPRDIGYCWKNGRSLTPAYADAVFMPVAIEVNIHVG